jgi:hypothetical protein
MKTAAAKSNKTGKPPGRPKGSDRYLPEMDELVVKLGREGASKTQMATACGVVRSTLDAWAEAHPSLKAALQLALEHAQAFWEAMGQRGCMMGKDFNAATYNFQMRNRFRHDYTEKQTIEHQGDSFREFLTEARAGKLLRAPNPYAGKTDAELIGQPTRPITEKDNA